MLSSVLLHLDDARQSDPVIRVGIDVARRCGARVRGLTMVDTRGVETACCRESAVYVLMEQNFQHYTEKKQEAVRAELSRACLEAGLNFDVRRERGNPLQVLPREARYHDLVIASIGGKASAATGSLALSETDVRDLLLQGVQPLVVVPNSLVEINRVLLVYDGSEAAGRGIRSYLNQQLFPAAEHRLLAVGTSQAEARLTLREMADYCAPRLPSLETGMACGKLPSTLSKYADKWQADMIVMGVGCDPGWFRRWHVGSTMRWITRLSCAVYMAT